MVPKKHTAGPIIRKLMEAEVGQGQGKTFLRAVK